MNEKNNLQFGYCELNNLVRFKGYAMNVLIKKGINRYTDDDPGGITCTRWCLELNAIAIVLTDYQG